MKKIIKIFLPLIVLLTSLNINVQAEAESVSERTLESLEILQELGFVSEDYNQETIDFNETVTRAEFAKVAGEIFNVMGQKGNNLYFYDVPNDYHAYDAVTYLTDIGAVSVNDEKLFRPQAEITVTEASKIVLYALGYKTIVEASGGYPDGVTNTSVSIDLLDGVSAKEGKLTFGGMFNLLYNAIMTEVFEITGGSGMNLKIESKGNTFLNNHYGIYFEKGIFTGFNGVYYGDTECFENQAVINDTMFETDGREYFEFLGCEVKYLYEYNERDGEYKLIWVKATDKTEVLELDSVENSTEFDEASYELEYWDSNNKKQSIELTKSISVIYNGRLLDEGIAKVLDGEFDTIRLVKKDSEREYSLAVVDSCESFVVGDVDRFQQKIYDKHSEYFVDLESVKEVYIYNASGLLSDINAVTKNCVVSVYSSKDGDITKIYISDNIFEGKITSFSDDGTVTYTIGDKVYKLDKNYNPANHNTGGTVKVYVDVNSKIVFMEKMAGSKKFAYLVDGYMADDMETFVVVKMFTEDGKMIKYNCKNTAKLDGIVYKNSYPEGLYNALGGDLITPQLVMYSLNENDEIMMIDTIAKDKESDFCRSYERESRTYKGGKLIATTSKGSMMIGSSTVMFRIPNDPQTAQDFEFGIMKTTSFYDWRVGECEGYSANQDSFSADALVWYSNGTTSEDGYMFVDKVLGSLNDDGERVIQITGYYGSSELSLKTDSDYMPSDLKRGDVVLLTKNAKGDVIDSKLVYRKGEINPGFKYDHHNEYRIIWGYVYDSGNGFVRIASSPDATQADDIYKIGTVWIYHTDGDYIEKSTIADLVGTRYAKGDEIIIYSRQGYVSTAYAIR